MNAIVRFLSLGAQDADRRVARALRPSSLEAGDRYLKTSALVSTLDRATQRLRDWWMASEAHQLLSSVQAEVSPASHGSIAVTLLIAVSAHVALTLLQGPRPGWFWMVIPGMAALFAVLVLAGSRSSQSH